MYSIELGLGLLSIGRQWGARSVPAPTEETAARVILTAYDAGIRFFDTAPAYRRSESILGNTLAQYNEIRVSSVISTKVGEHWDYETDSSYVDHSYDALKKSFDSSMEKLAKIDIIQLHKANCENVISRSMQKFIEYANSSGVTKIGASVSDIKTAEIVCQSGMYEYIQFPYNVKNWEMGVIFDWLNHYKIKAIVNRPFAMGAVVSESLTNSKEEAFEFILRRSFEGVILTGTSSVAHLIENADLYKRCVTKCG